MTMGKYILFAAAKYNCGLIRRDSGEWLNTKYVVYSDGTCWTLSKYREQEPYRKSILRHVITEQEYLKAGKNLGLEKWFRMDVEKFERLKELLETQFDGAEFEVIQIQLLVFSFPWTFLGCRPQGASRIQIQFL